MFSNSYICTRVALTLSKSTRSMLKPTRAKYQKTEEERKKDNISVSGHALGPCEQDQMLKTKLVNMKLVLDQEHSLLHMLRLLFISLG